MKPFAQAYPQIDLFSTDTRNFNRYRSRFILGAAALLLLIATLSYIQHPANILKTPSDGHEASEQHHQSTTSTTGTHHNQDLISDKPKKQPSTSQLTSHHDLDNITAPCANLAGATDIFVVLKTGATELRSILPAHLNSTFLCAPNYSIYSDLSETLYGQKIHDILSDLPPALKSGSADFQLYNDLRSYQDAGRIDFDNLLLSEETGLKETTRAWQLDKWKYLPMIEKVALDAPGYKWYLFIEGDTNIVWSNLHRWLSSFDPSKKWYIGAPAMLDNQEFAHAGAGYILSAPALKALLPIIQKQSVGDMMKFVHKECCGDLIIGMLLEKLGIKLTETWPMMQSESMTTLDYTEHHWCSPVVSQHHMNPEQMEQMWTMDQEWIEEDDILRRTTGRQGLPLRHGNVFEELVERQLENVKAGWDNLSGDRVYVPQNETESEEGRQDWDSLSDTQKVSSDAPESCRQACEEDMSCVQWVWSVKKCRLGYPIRLGHASEKAKKEVWISGWILDRVSQFKGMMKDCEVHWILPDSAH